MPAIISMLRAINLGSHNRIKMEDLRAFFESVGVRNPQTYVQSGNVIFKTEERDLAALSKRIETSFQRKFGFHSDVILRTAAEMKDVIARNPFANREGIEPGKLLVTFLAAQPSPEAREYVLSVNADPEELHLLGRELYIYFPNGSGRTKLPAATIGRRLKTPGTARNWNSIIKMLEIAERL
jgi:uncharacterized protein (DUF1697 family)